MEKGSESQKRNQYRICIDAFINELSYDELPPINEIVEKTIEFGADPDKSRIWGKICSNKDAVYGRVACLKMMWEQEWKNNFSKLSDAMERYKSMRSDRSDNDPGLAKSEPSAEDIETMGFEAYDQGENYAEQFYPAYDRATDWVSQEEGITPRDYYQILKHQDYFIINKMSEFLANLGKPVPHQIKSFLYDSPFNPNRPNQN